MISIELRTKIFKYCSYQERCHQEVKKKLEEYGLKPSEIDLVLVDLIENNLLNEERFAKMFCRGKFVHNKWGKVKIVNELKRRQISDYCINSGLKEVEFPAYQDQLKSLLNKNFLKQKGSVYVRRSKSASYMVQKGYEAELVWSYLREME